MDLELQKCLFIRGFSCHTFATVIEMNCRVKSLVHSCKCPKSGTCEVSFHRRQLCGQGNSLGFTVLEKKSCGFSVPLFLYLSDVIRFR